MRSNILFNSSVLIRPAIEAFLRALINCSTIKGTTITSDSQPAPTNPFSIIKITVSIASQAKVFLAIFKALYVLNPSLFIPDHIPKIPSNHNTATTAKYYSMLSIDKSKK